MAPDRTYVEGSKVKHYQTITCLLLLTEREVDLNNLKGLIERESKQMRRS